MTSIPMPPEQDEDRAFEDKRQREIDDAREAQEARFAGREAGRKLIAAGLNPYPLHSPQYDVWECARSETIARNHSRRAA
jgi:hypothetical protein